MQRTPWAIFVTLLFLTAAYSPLVAGDETAAGADDQPARSVSTIEQDASQTLDHLVNQSLQDRNQSQLPPISDEQFVRRLYLDAVGRIPTPEEAHTFLNSDAADKRSTLVDQLVPSSGYVSHQFNFWANLLRVIDRDAGISRTFYVNWLKDALAANQPYDEMVRELLTSSGNGWDRGHGAVGYYLRDRGMPLANMANTLRVFLGTQLACAQCHDHPNDKWTRRQFYELAAFSDGLNTENKGDLFRNIYAREKTTEDTELRGFSQYIRNTFRRDFVSGAGTGVIELPKDYQYTDAKPGEAVAAQVIFQPNVAASEGEASVDGREQFAHWLTSPDNARFTKVIANRMWKRTMGVGLIEPVDELKDDTEASCPELMEYLTQLMIDLDYDLQAFARVLFKSKTYQRATLPSDQEVAETSVLRGRPLQRMTAEQIWDSLITLVVANVDERKSEYFDTDIEFRGQPVFVGEKDMFDRYDEVKDDDLEGHWEFLARELAAMKEDWDQRYGKSAKKQEKPARAAQTGGELLVRASELRAPESPSHFLRRFGQSNREFVDGGSIDGNVTQFLSLFNGFAESNILDNSDAILLQQLSHQSNPTDKTNLVFLSILTRLPTDVERAQLDEFSQLCGEGYSRDLIWTLLNSHEFLFIQ